jgi:hypothetical protein
MSAPFAISAVTATLRGIMSDELTREGLPSTVTTRPLDRVATAAANAGSHVNLFLYHLGTNGAWRNTLPASYSRGGENPWPPLALDLFYLVTAFAGSNEDTPHPLSQRLLGCCMRALHDHPLVDGDRLVREDFADANNYRHAQVEHVRITPQPMSLEEMSKLWTTFQTNYRLSVAYQVSVVLIESTRPTTAALPVLRRGTDDRGAMAQADVLSPLPTLEALRSGTPNDAIRLGDRVQITGLRLDGDNVVVRFTHARTGITVDRPPDAGATASSLSVTLANDAATAAAFPAGIYSVSVVITRASDAGSPRPTNALPMILAPRLVIPAGLATIDGVDPLGRPTHHVRLGAVPQVRPSQRASLLVGGTECAALPVAAPVDQLEFDVTGVPAGTYFARLRVDGIDSFLIDRSVTPPQFDMSQQITLP